MTAVQLHIKYELIDRKKDYEVIDFFEKNAVMIHNLDEDRDKDTLLIKTNLLSDYGYSLAKSGQVSKSIPILQAALRLHERQLDFRSKKTDTNGYQTLLFLFGEGLYKTDRIDQSREAFDRLLSLNPTNESYKSWFVRIINHKRSKISRFAFLAFAIWLLVSVLFKDVMIGWMRLTFNLIGLTLFITWTIVDVKNWLIKRKYS